ncbi:MAG: DUF3150 domain-containing protein [Deltaproteobacteria bacterium]|nr:DUF3150 domain-containing protein [Deltaproteobacteria bacterium]
MQTTQIILDQMNLVVLNISLYQGRKAIKKADLALTGIDVGKLPPGTLATLGSKRIISPKALRIFSKLRRSARKLCLYNGVRFGGCGYAIPRERIEALSSELKKVKDEFETAKANFLSVYQEEVEKWVAENPPEWAQIIRGAIDSPSYIDKAISFNYAAFEARPPAEVMDNGLDEEVNSLYGQMCHEVRVAARRAYDNSFVGKKEISQKALRPIKTIRAKLVGLLFLDPSIGETIQAIDDTLAKIPTEGPIKGTDLNMLAGLLGRQLANMGRVVQQRPESEEETCDETPDGKEADVSEHTGKVAPITWDF